MARCVPSLDAPAQYDLSPPYTSGALQIGGGITAANAREWLDAGASKVSIALRSEVRLNLFR